MTNAYLNARFSQGLTLDESQKAKVAPLVSMSASTLERAISAISRMPFSEILENRISEDPLLGRPFEAASSYVPKGMPGGLFEHIEIMKALTQEIQTDFGMVEG